MTGGDIHYIDHILTPFPLRNSKLALPSLVTSLKIPLCLLDVPDVIMYQNCETIFLHFQIKLQHNILVLCFLVDKADFRFNFCPIDFYG